MISISKAWIVISMESFEDFEWLNDYAPCFEAASKDIEILHSPEEFINALNVREDIGQDCEP
jgi:hypothetical protein